MLYSRTRHPDISQTGMTRIQINNPLIQKCLNPAVGNHFRVSFNTDLEPGLQVVSAGVWTRPQVSHTKIITNVNLEMYL